MSFLREAENSDYNYRREAYQEAAELRSPVILRCAKNPHRAPERFFAALRMTGGVSLLPWSLEE
jgi:hypothetical protein